MKTHVESSEEMRFQEEMKVLVKDSVSELKVKDEV